MGMMDEVQLMVKQGARRRPFPTITGGWKGTPRSTIKIESDVPDQNLWRIWTEPSHSLESQSEPYERALSNPEHSDWMKEFWKSDPYYHNILVGGCMAGGRGLQGMSYLPFGCLVAGRNRDLFRHDELEKIRSAIDAAVKQGKNVRVFGHSWGGATVSGLAKDYPGIQFYALDPTSWTGKPKEIPRNLTVLTPRNPYTSGDDINSKLARILGNSWQDFDKVLGRHIFYDGGHVSNLDFEVDRINDLSRLMRKHPRLRDALLRWYYRRHDGSIGFDKPKIEKEKPLNVLEHVPPGTRIEPGVVAPKITRPDGAQLG